MIGRLFKLFLGLALVGVIGVGVAGVVIYKRLEPNLPDIDALNDVELHVPLLVYSSDSKLLAEYGEKRREQLLIEDTPQVLIDAVLASEDDRFYEHPGVDYRGLLRAGVNLIKTGRKGQGGSTVTMQVARNIYLSPEKTYLRKINEILLALKIERQISKASILELYLNILYLGNRAYGVASAAKVYYGKDVTELTLAEAAMIAGLPKAPSIYNPIVNPERALIRRNYVLRRMLETDKIDRQQYQSALEDPVTAALHRTASELEASYVSEMARAQMVEWLGPEAYTGGYKVYTTIDSTHQLAATKALRKALVDYEKRHGFRIVGKASAADAQSQEQIDIQLSELPVYGSLKPAMITATTETEAQAVLIGGEKISIPWGNMEWASPRSEDDPELPEFGTPGEVLSALDFVHVAPPVENAVTVETQSDQNTADGKPVFDHSSYSLAQMPEVEGALVSLSPQTGKILSLVGGFDFYRSKFNRITQAYRQPGSNFKPFIYSAALEHGDTSATIYNDTPVVLDDSVLEDEWRPRNYSGRFFGPTRLREALVKSRNLVSIRVLQELGIPRAIRYAERFNFEPRSLPRNLSLALGSGDMTPLQLASAYTVFANNGYSVKPRYIERIVDGSGKTIYQSAAIQYCETDEECAELEKQNGGVGEIEDVAVVDPNADEFDPNIEPTVGAAQELADEASSVRVRSGVPTAPLVIVAPRVIEERNAYIMRSIMREVVSRGTARKARELARSDIAGKTGTTNDLYDAWFTGFNSSLVSTAWVGFDEQRSLGAKESGGIAALPMWIDYMRTALNDVPEDNEFQPEGIATVRIDRKTGKLATPGADGSFFEYFREEYIPTEYADPFTQTKSVETGTQQTARRETTDTRLSQQDTAARTSDSQGIVVPINGGDELAPEPTPKPRIEPRVQSRVENNNRKKKVEQLF